MIPTGFLLSLEEAPNAISNFLEGLDAQWWGADVQDRPVSRLIDKDSWGTIYADAHLRNLTEHLSTLSDRAVCEPYYIAIAQNEKTMPLAESSAEEKQTLLVAVDLNDNSSIELAQRFAGFTSDSLEVLFAPIDSSAKVPDGISLVSETVDTYALQHPHVPVVSLVDCRAQNECAPVATISLVQAIVR